MADRTADYSTIQWLRSRGHSLAEISEFCGISKATASRAIRGGPKAIRQEKRNRRGLIPYAGYEEKPGPGSGGDIRAKHWSEAGLLGTLRESAVRREDVDEARARLPKQDRRDLTGRLLGDPLPEQSALAQRRNPI